MTPSDSGEAGFALLEALAALLLGALIFSTMLLAGDMVARRLDAAFQKADRLELFETGLAALRRDFQSALAVPVDSEEEPAILFSGGESSLAFVSGPNGLGGRLDELATIIEARPEGLVRRAAPLLPNASDFGALQDARPALLIAGPWFFRFSYAEELGPPLVWRSQWTAAKELPKLIRLEVVERAEPHRVLMSLNVAPRVNAVFPAPDDESTTANEERLAEREATDE